MDGPAENPTFGLLLSGQSLPGEDPGRAVREALEQVRLARDVGFQSVWVSQHFLSDYQFLQPIPLLSRIVEVSGEMQLGTAVALLPLYPPVLLAEEVASLDQISGGRFTLGAGIGYRDAEYSAMGLDRADGPGRFEECIGILRNLWSGSAVTHDGLHFKLRDAALGLVPVRREVPIWIGASGPRSVARAARIGDEWLVGPEQSLVDIGRNREHYDRALPATQWGKKQFPLIRECLVLPKGARRLATGPLSAKYDTYSRTGFGVKNPEDLLNEVFLIGDPSRVKSAIRDCVLATESKHLIFRMQWPGLEHHSTMDSIETFGAEVRTAFEKSGSSQVGGRRTE